jgi:hypothetical protein
MNEFKCLARNAMRQGKSISGHKIPVAGKVFICSKKR